jgi:hypothetical protein
VTISPHRPVYVERASHLFQNVAVSWASNRELVSDSLVYRYNPAASPDGLHGDAMLTFERMHTYGNHLGLFSGEIGSTGEQLGNFPQAFTQPVADQRRDHAQSRA